MFHARDKRIVREWEPVALSLTDDDVRALQSLPRHHRVLEPMGRGVWLLTIRNHSGVLALPSFDLFIRPKIASSGVMGYMLRHAFQLLEARPGTPALAHDPEFPQVMLVNAFLSAVEEILRKGLNYGYVETSDQHLRSVRGSVDIPAQLQRNHSRPDRLACKFEEFTPDTIDNQLLYAALLTCSRMPFLTQQLRQRGRRHSARFTEISALPATAALALRPTYNRLNERYRYAHTLAILLLRQVVPGFKAGFMSGQSFLLNMFHLWERFVAGWLNNKVLRQADAVLLQQSRFFYSADEGTGPWGQPDLVLRLGAGRDVVIDTKYKDPGDSHVDGADIAQVLAYATCLGARRAILLYPSEQTKAPLIYRIVNTQVRLEIVFIHVGGGIRALDLNMEQLATSLFGDLQHHLSS